MRPSVTIRRSKSLQDVVKSPGAAHDFTDMLIRVKLSSSAVITLKMSPLKDILALRHMVVEAQEEGCGQEPSTPTQSPSTRWSDMQRACSQRRGSGGAPWQSQGKFLSEGRVLPRLFLQVHFTPLQ